MGLKESIKENRESEASSLSKFCYCIVPRLFDQKQANDPADLQRRSECLRGRTASSRSTFASLLSLINSC